MKGERGVNEEGGIEEKKKGKNRQKGRKGEEGERNIQVKLESIPFQVSSNKPSSSRKSLPQ